MLLCKVVRVEAASAWLITHNENNSIYKYESSSEIKYQKLLKQVLQLLMYIHKGIYIYMHLRAHAHKCI